MTAHTYTGTAPDGTNIMVTVYGNGEAHLATREHSWATWSPPVVLTRRPVRTYTGTVPVQRRGGAS